MLKPAKIGSITKTNHFTADKAQNNFFWKSEALRVTDAIEKTFVEAGCNSDINAETPEGNSREFWRKVETSPKAHGFYCNRIAKSSLEVSLMLGRAMEDLMNQQKTETSATELQ